MATSSLFALQTGTLAQQISPQSPDEPSKDSAWLAEANCEPRNKVLAWVDGREFLLCYKVDYAKLRPRSDGQPDTTDMTITSFTNRSGSNLSSMTLKVPDPLLYPGLDLGKPEPNGPERNGHLSSSKEFKSRLTITKEAKPTQYLIDASIASGKDIKLVEFKLPLTSTPEGALEILAGSLKTVDCWTGSNCSPLRLVFRNRLPYRLQNGQVTLINSEPPDLVQEAVVLDPQSVAADEPQQVTKLFFSAQSISLPRIFSGFGKSPLLHASIKYEDEYGRIYFTNSDVYPQIKPNILVLAIFLLLGVVVGTIIRIDLRRLQKAGLITKGQRAMFAATTFGSGILVCLIALFANLKIVVLDDQNSYSAWDPKVIFLTALVGTIGGIPIIYGFLKLPKQSDAAEGAGRDPKYPSAPDDHKTSLGQRKRHASTKLSH